MQVGKVDIPSSCKVCGANLADLDGEQTCGDACARVLRFGETPEVARVRAKIAARLHRCDPKCVGWAVFNADTDPVLEACIDCWSNESDILYSEEIEALPEAEQELSLAINDGDAYEQPDTGEPCACGCVVQRRIGVTVHCSACGGEIVVPSCPKCVGKMHQCATGAIGCFHCNDEHCCGFVLKDPTAKSAPAPPFGRDEPIFIAALAAMDRAEEINGPEGDDYRRLMRAIEVEARTRRLNYDKE